MENGADGEIEEPFIPVNRPFRSNSEKGVALLFQGVEKALAPVIDPISDIWEAELSLFVFFEKVLEIDFCQKKPSDHFQQIPISISNDLFFHSLAFAKMPPAEAQGASLFSNLVLI